MGSGAVLPDAKELILIVEKLCRKYTSGESSSVTWEKAQQLMQAVLYCLEEDGSCGSSYLSSQAEEVSWERYETGYQRVLEKTYRAKEIYERLIMDFEDYGCRNYSDTVLKGLPGFFLRYDPRFDPQNHVLTLDYPLLSAANQDIADLRGVDLIWEYLRGIDREKNFLQLFDREAVIRLLLSIQPEYKSLFLDNICETVLYRAVLCLIADRNITDLILERGDETRIREFVSENLDQGEEALCKRIKGMIHILTHSTCVENDYFLRAAKDFGAVMKNACKTLFFVQK